MALRQVLAATLALTLGSCTRAPWPFAPAKPTSTSPITASSTTRAPSPPPSIPPARPPTVRFIGRVDRSNAARPRFSWPGTSVVTRFTGTQLHVRLRETGYDELEVEVDGAPVGVISTNALREDYLVVSGLHDGPHDLVLSKRTEARMGELTLIGFEPSAALTPPAEPRGERRIELVGDSITAGYGSEGAGPTCTGNIVALENEYLSYGAVAARSLGAEHVTIAWAGRTITEMSGFYDRTLATRAGSAWDFKAWTPSVVVINLGTNDFNRGDPGELAFTRPYLAFLRRLRALYPRALLVCALGTMLSDTYPAGAHALAKARAYITATVAKAKAAGDARIVFLEFAPRDPMDGLGCDYHPSVKTHRAMAERLASVLRSELAW